MFYLHCHSNVFIALCIHAPLRQSVVSPDFDPSSSRRACGDGSAAGRFNPSKWEPWSPGTLAEFYRVFQSSHDQGENHPVYYLAKCILQQKVRVSVLSACVSARLSHVKSVKTHRQWKCLDTVESQFNRRVSVGLWLLLLLSVPCHLLNIIS